MENVSEDDIIWNYFLIRELKRKQPYLFTLEKRIWLELFIRQVPAVSARLYTM